MIAPHRPGFRLAALLTVGSLMAGCAPAGPGPYQQQASYAAQACQQGYAQACYDYQALAPVADAEAYRSQQDAAVGTAVVAGVVGAVAGAAIVGSARSRRGYDRHRGRYDRSPGYGRHYHRGYYR